MISVVFLFNFGNATINAVIKVDEVRLAYITNNGDNKCINFLDFLDDEQYKAILNATDILSKTAFNRNLFKIFSINVSDFFDHLPELLKLCIGSELNIQTSNLSLDCNRFYINLLSSFRAYIDHSETYLKRTYGINSQQVIQFKDKTSEIFDGNFTYRFISKLRNYSQHCGLPINSMTYSGHIEQGTEINTYKLELYFDVKDLREKFDWGKKLDNDFNNQPEKIDVVELTKELHLLTTSLLYEIELIDKPRVDNAVNVILDCINKVPEKESRVCIFTNIIRNEMKTPINFSVMDLSQLLCTHFNEL